MALDYKLEYIKSSDADEGVFIHIKSDPGEYKTLISKEEYMEDDEPNPLMDLLFQIPGVVRSSVQAYRVYVEKSPVFVWPDIMAATISKLLLFFNQTQANKLPGSDINLGSLTDRRAL